MEKGSSSILNVEDGKPVPKSHGARLSTGGSAHYLRLTRFRAGKESWVTTNGGGPGSQRESMKTKALARDVAIEKKSAKVGQKIELKRNERPATNTSQQTAAGQQPVRGDEGTHAHAFHAGNHRPHECDICKRRFRSLERAGDHKRCVPRETRIKLKCFVCGTKRHAGSGYDRHVRRRHMRPKNVSCHHCGGTFKCEYDLALHVQHNHKRRGEERVGDTTGPRREVLHREMRSGRNPVDREGTGNRNVILKSRERRVNRVRSRPFICDFEGCKKTYFDGAYFLRHQLTHSETRPFLCEFCDKGYKWKVSLDTHVMKEHPAATGSPPETVMANTGTANNSNKLNENTLARFAQLQIETPNAAPNVGLESSDEIEIVDVIEESVEGAITAEEVHPTAVMMDHDGYETETGKDSSENERGAVAPNFVARPREDVLAMETEAEAWEKELMIENLVARFKFQCMTDLKNIMSYEMPQYPFF